MKMGMIRQRKSERVEMSKSERVVEIRVNGAPLAVLKTDCAVAADYIQFMEAITRALMVPEARSVKPTLPGKPFYIRDLQRSALCLSLIPQIPNEGINAHRVRIARCL